MPSLVQGDSFRFPASGELRPEHRWHITQDQAGNYYWMWSRTGLLLTRELRTPRNAAILKCFSQAAGEQKAPSVSLEEFWEALGSIWPFTKNVKSQRFGKWEASLRGQGFWEPQLMKYRPCSERWSRFYGSGEPLCKHLSHPWRFPRVCSLDC
jgi:hypothetical protein